MSEHQRTGQLSIVSRALRSTGVTYRSSSYTKLDPTAVEPPSIWRHHCSPSLEESARWLMNSFSDRKDSDLAKPDNEQRMWLARHVTFAAQLVRLGRSLVICLHFGHLETRPGLCLCLYPSTALHKIQPIGLRPCNSRRYGRHL